MNIKLISKYRSSIMGIAMILIIIYHTTVNVSGLLDSIKSIGNFGVNIFFFMSGLSMFYSWNNKPDTKRFLFNRFVKLGILFFPVIFVWCTPQLIIHRIGIVEYLLKISTINFWINGNLLYWFVSAIFGLYLITPIWMKLFTKNHHITFIVTLVILFGMIVLERFGLFSHIRIFIERAPNYFMGIYAGYLAINDKKLSKSMLLGISLPLIFSLIFNIVLKEDINDLRNIYLVYLFATMPVIVIFASLFERLFKGIESKTLSTCGMITFETYLFQEKITIILTSVLSRLHIKLDCFNIILNLLAIAVTIVVAYIWHVFGKYVFSIIKSKVIYKKKRAIEGVL